MFELDNVSVWDKDHRALHGVFELADVAGPAVVLDERLSFLAEVLGLSCLLVHVFEEAVGEQ